MTELAALLKLCDDSSPNVANKVASRLREIADLTSENDLWSLIESQNLPVSSAQRAILQEILAAPLDNPEISEAARTAQLEEHLRAAWGELRFASDETSLLETALLALCDWQSGAGTGARGRQLLDEMALEFGDFEMPSDVEMGEWSEAATLSYFLFDFKDLRGASASDYYHPLQSNLTIALENRRGLPITLACIFILVGRRVGLSIQGCSFPGHFLARDSQTRRIFDPYNGGKALSAREVGALQRAAPSEMSEAATTTEIVARVLRNLSVAYYQSGESQKSALMIELLRALEN